MLTSKKLSLRERKFWLTSLERAARLGFRDAGGLRLTNESAVELSNGPEKIQEQLGEGVDLGVTREDKALVKKFNIDTVFHEVVHQFSEIVE